MLKPADVGLKFEGWRGGQLDLLVEILSLFNDGKKYVVLEAPTGAGKSGIAVGLTLMGEMRSVVLTHTKQLQEQYEGVTLDERDVRLVMGRANYSCLVDKDVPVDEAMCTMGVPCDQEIDCPYKVAVYEALTAKVAVLNYAYYLPVANYTRRFHNRDILILDEGHLAEDELMRFVEVRLPVSSLKKVGVKLPNASTNIYALREWAGSVQARLKKELSALLSSIQGAPTKEDVKMAGRLRNITNQLEKLIHMPDKAIIEPNEMGLSVRPLWLTNYGRHLFLEHKNVLLMSATPPTPAILERLLGVPAAETAFLRVGSTFHPNRRPLYHGIADVRTGKGAGESDLERLVEQVDEILEKYYDKKGVVHTVNYRLTEYLLKHSRHAWRMVSHDVLSRTEVLMGFKASDEPLVLVSPSMHTGVDLPYDQCRFQIIAKLPFPDLGDKQIKQRMEEDKSWYNWKTVNTLVQTYGRGMRAPDDWCATYVLDATFDAPWFRKLLVRYAPEWFLEARRRPASLTGGLNLEEGG